MKKLENTTTHNLKKQFCLSLFSLSLFSLSLSLLSLSLTYLAFFNFHFILFTISFTS